MILVINYGLKTTMNSDEAVARGEIGKKTDDITLDIHKPLFLGMF